MSADSALLPHSTATPAANAPVVHTRRTDRKWSPLARTAFIIGSATSLWASIFWLLAR